MKNKEDIYVYMDWYEWDQATYMGTLSSEQLRGKEIFSFAHDRNWLQYPQFRALDPHLGSFEGKQYLPGDLSNFGVFLDSSPDRWGRLLMHRREVLLAKKENRTIKKLKEIDYLLGVYDGNRMGALRFKRNPNEDFLDNNKTLAAPPWSSIRDLEHASLQLENASHSNEYEEWLKMLIVPGSSLGGARPKANITDEQGHLWIAKFPSRYDQKNIGAWEAVIFQLSQMTAINMSPCKAIKFGAKHHTFLTKRFDRTSKGKRIHFASAMTLLGYNDGADNISYLELAEWIIQNSHQVDADLEQLWRRIIFNIAVSNCDDHLRNHGFILSSKGWELSPAFDINPDEYGNGLKLNITEEDNSLDFHIALSTAEYYGLPKQKAKKIIDEICSAVSQWQSIATKYGISKEERERMALAFHSTY